MAIPTTQLFSRQEALSATALPMSIDSIVMGAGGAAVTYTVPAGTTIVVLTTDKSCLFREGSVAAAMATNAVGEGSTWIGPGQARSFRVKPGQTISFIGDGVNDCTVAIERYTGTNATLPPD